LSQTPLIEETPLQINTVTAWDSKEPIMFAYILMTRVLAVASLLLLLWTYTLKADKDLCQDLIIDNHYMSDEECHLYHPERYK
jgi:hypothetical protein